MPPRKDDDERERPSWREIDQRRDGSRHRGPASPPVPKAQAESVRQQALAQAEALFKGKRARPEYRIDLKKLEASSRQQEISRPGEEVFGGVRAAGRVGGPDSVPGL